MIKATAVLITKQSEYPKEALDALTGKFDEILIETSCPAVFRRYDLALRAKNEIIYFQDDDCVVDVEALFKAYDGRITNNISPGHFENYKDKGVTLIGWGAFFPKSMINFVKYLAKHPIDSLFLSQTDRIFTYLNQPFNQQIITINHLPSATATDRMSTQADHWSNLERILWRLNTLNES